MAARLSAPVTGALGRIDDPDRPWEVAIGYRYQESDRHFRGSHEETNRAAEHSEVINTINLLDVTISRDLDTHWQMFVSVPYLMAERSSPIRDDSGDTIARSITQARGVGDIIGGARRWLWDPVLHPRSNMQFGFGLKLPTGADNVHDTRTRYDSGEYVQSVETVDQSIQPGDGGFGILLTYETYRWVNPARCAAYFSAAYLLNPEGTNGVFTYRSRPSEQIMSIADQYLARAGLSFPVPRWRGGALSLGGRIEGIPAEDVLGPSDGFRRPGYAVSVEPGLSWVRGPHAVTATVPIALYRNRVRSVPDMMDGRHGDAAFADWLLVVSYQRRFGSMGYSDAAAAAACASTPARRD